MLKNGSNIQGNLKKQTVFYFTYCKLFLSQTRKCVAYLCDCTISSTCPLTVGDFIMFLIDTNNDHSTNLNCMSYVL